MKNYETKTKKYEFNRTFYTKYQRKENIQLHPNINLN